MTELPNIPNQVLQNPLSNEKVLPFKKLTIKRKFVLPTFAIGLLFLVVAIASGFYTVGKQAGKKEQKENSISFVGESLSSNSPTPTNSPTVTPTPPKKTITKIVLGQKELDGYVQSDGVINTNLGIRIGRNVNFVSRGFASFELADLPTGITIVAANLRLYQESVVGTPYTLIGEIRVDHLTYGTSLDDTDYSTPALVSNTAVLSISNRIGWKEADVTKAVKDDISNARDMSQFRVHFSKEVTGGDTKGDIAVFTASDKSASENKPQLVVEYY